MYCNYGLKLGRLGCVLFLIAILARVIKIYFRAVKRIFKKETKRRNV